MKNKKKEHGQFYTSRSEYIFSGIEIPDDIECFIEPFCGDGEMISYLENYCKTKNIEMKPIEIFDIDPKIENATIQDTIIDPPDYRGKYIVTNPPFLASNKIKIKHIFKKYNENDHFKCFLRTLIIDDDNFPIGGQVVVPLNFLSSFRAIDTRIRNDFLKYYTITRINVFEEQVFDETGYVVCAFQFSRKKNPIHEIQNVETIVFPTKEKYCFAFDPAINNIICGELYFLETDPRIRVRRFTIDGKYKEPNTKMRLKLLDDEHLDQPGAELIGLWICETIVKARNSNRSFATLIVENSETGDPIDIPIDIQKEVCDQFNALVSQTRARSHSLFLPNFRQFRGQIRKRMPFELAYRIVNHLLKDKQPVALH